MAKLVLWIVLTTSILIGITQNTYGQCSFTSVAGGTTASPLAWTTNATWSGGTAPATGSPSGNVCIGNGVYTSVVRINSANTFNGSVTINVQANSTLIINGDLHIASNITVIVQLGGTLTVNGALYTDNAGGVPKFTNLGTATVTDITVDGAGVITNGSGTNSTAQLSASGNFLLKNGSGSSSTNYGTFALTGSANASNPLTNSGTFTVGNGFTLTSSGGSSLTNSGTLGVTGSISISKTVTNSGTINVSVDYTQGGSTTTNTGNINVSGDVYATGGAFQLTPAASANSNLIINGSLTIDANENMKVGTGSTCTASTFYANLVVKTNVKLTGSGDIKVYSNGRMIVFGNIDGTTSSGTLVTVNCGGQAYVNGNVNLGTGGGNTVTNSNGAGSPTGSNGSPLIGLYVNGTTTSQNSSGTVGTKSDLQANDNTFYTYIAGISGSPLPITLSFFRLKAVSEEGVSLEWTTASELNFDYFNLQRSENGKDFETIAEVRGHGTTKESHSYNFTDKMVLSGTSYYRLQSVDFDGYTETFNVVSVRYETGKNVAVYPNPVTDSNLYFRLNFVPTNEILVTITAVNGEERVRSIITSNETDVSLGISLEPGIYIVKLASIDFNKVSRIVVK